MKCSVDGCSDAVRFKGLCGKHYKRQWRHGSPTKTLIIMNEGAKCSVEECERPAHSRTLCKMHYTQFYRTGSTETTKAAAGTGRPLTAANYILLTVNGKRKYEHIHLAEKALGKKLPEKAIVHHMNECPWDNFTPFNLVICPDQGYHMLLHARIKQLGIDPTILPYGALPS